MSKKQQSKSPAKRKPKPFPKGTKIWCLPAGCSTRHPYIALTVVNSYNPATKGSFLVTAGRPFYCIPGGVADARDVRPATNEGLAELIDKLADSAERTAERFEEIALQHRYRAVQMRNIADNTRKSKMGLKRAVEIVKTL